MKSWPSTVRTSRPAHLGAATAICLGVDTTSTTRFSCPPMRELTHAGVIMAIVFSAKINGNVADPNTTNNFYTGASSRFDRCARFRARCCSLSFSSADDRLRHLLGRTHCRYLQPAVRRVSRYHRIDRCLGRCGGSSALCQDSHRRGELQEMMGYGVGARLTRRFSARSSVSSASLVSRHKVFSQLCYLRTVGLLVVRFSCRIAQREVN